MKEIFQANVRRALALFTLIGLLALYIPIHAQTKAPTTTNPQDVEAIYRAQYEAINAGDVEASLALLSEDMISISLPPPPGIDPILHGKAALRKENALLISRHAHIEFTEFHVNGKTVNFRSVATDDDLKRLGVGYLDISGTAVVQNGLVVAETSLISKESLARLEAAIALDANKTAIRRNYEELWSKGNLAVADEITDSKVIDHHSGDTGTAGLKQIVTLMRKAFPALKVTINNLVADGDLVVADVTFDEGVYKGGLPEAFGVPDSAIGKSVKLQAIDVYRFKKGKIVEAWGLSDQLNWYKQLGVTLTPAKP
jgi:predicted ester cyclase/ketosteroid isomerase-like protein